MIGILLCGGLSTRMGNDKGLIFSNAKTWTEIGLGKFSKLKILATVSINPSQFQIYSSRFANANFVIDDPSLKIQGPLLGLMSAHLQFPNEDVLLLACDLINMNVIVLEKLVNEFKRSVPKAIAFRGERVEPLCAIYSSSGLKEILEQYRYDKIKQFNMSLVLDQLKANYLFLSEDWKKYFLNYNSPGDFRTVK